MDKKITAIKNAIIAMVNLHAAFEDYPEKQKEVAGAISILKEWKESIQEEIIAG